MLRDDEKPVPQDIDAEEAVLGSLLIDTEVVNRVAGIISPGDFARERHRWIYESCLALADRFEPTNQILVAHELQRQDRLEVAGGVAYLSQLINLCPTSVHAEDYANIIRKCSVNRQLMKAGAQIVAIGYENGEPHEALGRAQEQLLSVMGLGVSQGFKSFREIAAEREAHTEAWLENPQRPRGIPTKFVDLDCFIGGLKAGTFYVVAARPSIGKSQFAMWLALNVASQGHHAGIFGLEMPRGDILERARFAKARLDPIAIELGRGPSDWRERYNKARQWVDALPISVDDTDAITTGTARARAASLKAKYPNLGLIIFDYGEIAGDTNKKSEELRVSEISRRLQGMAHGLNLPVVGVFQLSRKVEERLGKVPQLADLRYSGMIEQAADVVLMLFRKGYYAERAQTKADREIFALAEGEDQMLEILIEKQRNGPAGKRMKIRYEVATGYMHNWGEVGKYGIRE